MMQAAENEVVHPAVVPEAHFVLGRVDVDIHGGRVHFQVQHKRRVASVIEHVLVSLTDCMPDQLVTNGPTVDVKMLQVRLAAIEARLRHPPPQAQSGALDINVQRLLHKRRAAHLSHPALALNLGAGFTPAVNRTVIVAQGEGDIEPGQGLALDDIVQMVVFGLFRAQEFAPGRGIEKQIPHFHRGAFGVGSRRQLGLHIPPFGGDLPTGALVAGITGQGQARHGTDTGQGLTAEPQGGHRLKVIQLANLAGGVATQGQGQIGFVDTTAVVAHSHQLDATVLNVHFNAGRARVQTIFQQLLDHR